MNSMTPIEAIRAISGIFHQDPDEMSTRLVICNLLSRYLLGDAEESFVLDTLKKHGIDIIPISKKEG